MPQPFGANQAPRITALYLNDVNDPAAGVPLASPSGSIVQAYGGQIGAKLTIGPGEATRLSDSAVGTLFEGVYQYVQFLGSMTATPTRGMICFWSDRANKVITCDVTAATQGKIAGVVLNSVTKGNWGFIQISGSASVQFKSTITKSTPANGDLVIVDQTPSSSADVLADATGLTSVTAKAIVGVADVVPVNNTITSVTLTFQDSIY